MSLPPPVPDQLQVKVTQFQHGANGNLATSHTTGALNDDTVQYLLDGIPCTTLKTLEDGRVYRPPLQDTFRTATSNNSSTPLDSGFVRQENPKESFGLGRVFRVLWAQPAGERNPQVRSGVRQCQNRRIPGFNNNSSILVGNHGGEVFHDIKRFVVVREGHNYCNAVQITSYHGRGISKRGVVKSEHTIAYTGDAPPDPMKSEIDINGETGMLPIPIRIIPDVVNGQQLYLAQPSRVNFGKLFTIEHNIRIQKFGIVHEESMNPMIYQFLSVHYPLWNTETLRPLRLRIGSLASDSCSTTSAQHIDGLLEPIYKVISGTGAKEEESTTDYRVRTSDFYGVGKVFTIMRCKEGSPEPERKRKGKGKGKSLPSIITDEFEGFDYDGLPILTQRRWFVVIKQGKNSSLCLRILSYENQGVPVGFIKSEHSAVYTGKRPPPLSAGECATREDPTTLKLAVRIVKKVDREAELLPSHRIRYSTVYRVNHDVMACPFGEVHEKFKWYLKQQAKAHFQNMEQESAEVLGTQLGQPWKQALEQLDSSDSAEDDPEPEDEESFVLRNDIPAPGHSEPMFKEGDRVLLPAKDKPTARARFRPLRVKEAKLVPLIWRWEYKLKHEKHEAEFAGGKFFSEDRLIDDPLT